MDERAAELLDAYLSALQAGRHDAREPLLHERPDLRSAIECLEALERLAPADALANAPLSADDVLSRANSARNERAERPGGNATDAREAMAGEPPALPRAFGAYELESELGRGGMGVVYKARQAGLNRFVAVKMILGSCLSSPEMVRRFQQEARIAAQLRHPNIVGIHEVGQVHGQHFFAMEYVAGESLAQRLAAAGGPLEPAEAVRVVAAVARAAAALHRHGLVHRDIKPSNILLDAQGQPLLTDFGLAKILAAPGELTASGVIAGTPSYMAPEQAAGRNAAVGPLADVYSLGAVLYECLTGRPPFLGTSPLDTVLDVLERDPPLPRQLNPKLPAALEWICLRCLAKSPDERYASAEALAADLERFARGEPLETRPPTRVRRILGWARRQPALAARLLGLGVFYLYDWFNVAAGLEGVTWRFHLQISLWLAIWAGGSILIAHWINQGKLTVPARFLWGLLDSAMLLAIMLTASGAASPLTVAYLLLIVGSAFWFHPWFVWFMTALSLASYGVLVVDFYFLRSADAHRHMDPGLDRHVIFAVAMLLCGGMTAYLTQRMRALSSYCGREP